MKRKNTTRNALVTSIISMLLCVSMLVGATFAWFTDSVVSGDNVIAAGNLDIELYNDGNRVTESTDLFDGILWEPGVVDYENFTIKNEGSLALLYDFAINWGDYNTLAGQYNLTQILKVAMIDGHVSGDRAAAIAAGEKAGWKALDSWSFKGEMTNKGDSKDFALIIYWEPTDNDNNWNVQNGKTLDKGDHLYVNLGIKLQATQKMHENDSFGKDYDALANSWDGSIGKVPAADENNVITLTTGAELAAFAASVNGGNKYSGMTVKLGADINLNNNLWTPIGQTGATQFAGAFDGNGKTIYNLKIDNTANTSEHGAAGLFGWVEQHSGSNSIKDLTIDGVTIYSHRYSGAIAGWINIPVTNCTVKNVTINCNYYNGDTDGTKVGALVGYADNKSALTGNTVENAVLNAYGDVGGLVGVAQTTVSVEGNTVKNVRINYASTVKSEPGALASTRVTPVYGTNTTENVTFVKSVIVSTADELAAALKSTDKDIVITLANNIDVPISSLGQQTGGSGEYKLAGEATETITLDLNSKKLNITTTYWSNIGAKNDDAVFTIKNGTMTSSQATGTWNSYDVTFSNCNYVIEDVVFEKAVAFANAGKSVVMSDVTIKETHDYYALWITAEGQTVEINGLTVNSAGRGIKIDEQYVGTPAKVTLKVSNADFNTVKKGAIMVKSAAGADITLSNVNIDDVIDATNAVWVDSDAEAYENLVTVTGGTKICESKVITNTAELNKALADGQTELLLAAGEYDVANGKGKTLTLTGLSKKAVIKPYNEGEDGCDYGFDGSTVTFNGVTIDTTSNTGNYKGYARMNATFNNCSFFGAYTSHQTQTFNNCYFDFNNGYFWIWGAKEVTFNNCEFDGNSKAILAHGWESSVININNCDFVATEKGYTGSGDNTAAVEIDPAGSNTYTININGGSITDAYAGWTRIKDGSTNHGISVDGATVVTKADELVAALEAGKDVVLHDNVKIDPASMSNAYGTTGINVKNGQTIDGNGNTLDIKGAGGTWDSGINTTGGLIKNVTVTGSFRGIFINHNSTYSERVVLENVTIQGTTYTISCDQGLNQGLTATKSAFKGWTSYAATLGDAKFVDCYFGEGNGYRFMRPYAPTEFVGCEFEAGYTVDPVAAVTFENCTIDGKPLTAENLATLVTNTANATVK